MKRRLKKYVEHMPVKDTEEIMQRLEQEHGIVRTDKAAKPAPFRGMKLAGLGVALCGVTAAVAISLNGGISPKKDSNFVASLETSSSTKETGNTVEKTTVKSGKETKTGETESAPVTSGGVKADGEIAGKPSRGGWSGIMTEGEAPAFCPEVDERYSMDMSKGSSSLIKEDVRSDLSGWEDGDTAYIENGIDAKAGTLTGGEKKDREDFTGWVEEDFGDLLAPWGLSANHRLRVDVGAPGETVSLVDENQETIFSAVSTTEGFATLYDGLTRPDGFNGYLIWNGNSVPVSYTESEGYTITDQSVFAVQESSDKETKLSLVMEREKGSGITGLDLMFMVDTTGSMGDELSYLKEEIADVIGRVGTQTGLPIRTSVNFYRDTEDEYVVRYFDFRDDAAAVQDIVRAQSADGGGDYPEAVEQAFQNALEHDWNMDAGTARLMFLVLDAPPHDTEEIQKKIGTLTREAAAKGIRVIPVSSSNADELTQTLTRAMALVTDGTFLFLDDNSGVSVGSHVTPVDPSEYTSELLNEMMIRVICEYCGGEKEVVEAPTLAETEPVTEIETETEYHQ